MRNNSYLLSGLLLDILSGPQACLTFPIISNNEERGCQCLSCLQCTKVEVDITR